MQTTNAEQIIEKAPFNKFHGILLFWGIILMVFDGYDLTVYGAVVPTKMEEWGISAVEAGVIGSYSLFGMMFGALIFGTIADKLGRKRVIIICTFIFSLFMLLTGLSNSPELFGFCRFITGLGLGGVMPNVIGLISDYSPKGTRSRMIATIMAGYSIGGIIAAALSIMIIPNLGWQSVFFFGALPLLFLPLLAKSLPDSAGSLIARNEYKKLKEILVSVNPLYKPKENEELMVNSTNESSSTVKSLFSESRAFSTVMLWVTYFMSLIMIYGLTTWLPKFMNEAGYSLGSSLGFLVSLNIGATIGAILMGWVADSWGVKKSLIMFYLIAAITITGFGFTTNMVFLYLLVAIAGATTIGSQNLANSYVSQYYPASMRSTGLGWALGIGRIGGILGPTIGGILLASSLSLQLSFIVFAIAGIIAAAAVFLTNRQPKTSAVSDLQKESTS
ncbi:MFS transporter [Virgibacillus siamensis]|uniref:MFS transporter n=1 Tax=Virgibacillus siamensis TaxID=480071 RepID=UPI00158BAABB|nr:aromatic acid/H+ symport family MFS transporter [Virgibacillus siamensis]